LASEENQFVLKIANSKLKILRTTVQLTTPTILQKRQETKRKIQFLITKSQI